MKKWLGWLPLAFVLVFYAVMVVIARERFLMFAPSLGFIALIAAAVTVYLRYAAKRWFPKEKIGSVEWVGENYKMICWRLSVPAMYILSPTAEELIFRGPLLLLFSSVTSSAWIGIAVSALLFGVFHWFNPTAGFSDMKKLAKTDDLASAAKEVEAQQPKVTLAKRISSVLATSVLGAIAGYYAIVYQSLWAGVAVHFVWNLVLPIILPLVILSITLVVVWIAGGVSSMYWRVRDSEAYKKRKEREAWTKECHRRREAYMSRVYRPEIDEGTPLSEDDAEMHPERSEEKDPEGESK
jgi:membrane protease YdiL (CAAX protease family)